MKGLLLKDWYLLRGHCRAYLLLPVLFFALALVSYDPFFLFYPCMLCGMIPVSLLGYDERSRWTTCSAALPYSRAQLVSVKYLIGLMVQGAVLLAGAAAYGIRLYCDDLLVPEELMYLVLLMLTLSMLGSALPLPFMFRLGVEKGRIAYYVMIGFVCGGSVLAGDLLSDRWIQSEEIDLWPLVLLAAVSVGIYALSWYLSVLLYRKREL